MAGAPASGPRMPPVTLVITLPSVSPFGMIDCTDGSAATIFVPTEANVSASGRCHATP